MRTVLVGRLPSLRSASRLGLAAWFLAMAFYSAGCSSSGQSAGEPTNVVVQPTTKGPKGEVRSRTPKN